MRWTPRPRPIKQDRLFTWISERHERKQREWLARVTQWHRWWSWHPVLIEGTWVWLEHVYRKGQEPGGHCGYGGMNWEYRFGLEG